jgi:hypothetical protein
MTNWICVAEFVRGREDECLRLPVSEKGPILRIHQAGRGSSPVHKDPPSGIMQRERRSQCLPGRMPAQHRANCANHPLCVIVLDLDQDARTWLGSGEGPYGSAKRYRGCYVSGRATGRWGWVLDEQSQLNENLVDAVGRLEGAWPPYMCGEAPSGIW